ncbi:hypothetical protein SPBR_04360 [Sporothrix brasiliensis 5110]|uniref:DUF7137 domain-containing protein n=1 Tax=Sporothrix brasiliensis 5110 TaxID=1398154 RepID=A0A0C2J3X6_9PEZI|nr:uncharacterized protein SPBR_04360 [Sporothrix brasiliensis 5110]KIH93690.1 hypothetical protein SPBR_04360 [Sporothrix brasiliensis 5110]
MKPSQSLGRVAFALLSMSTVTSAFSWSPLNLDAFVVRRADTTKTTSTPPAQTPGPNADNTFNLNTGAQETSTTTTATKDGKTTTGKDTAKVTPTDKNGNTATLNKTVEATRTTFNPVDPAGGVVMVTPATTANFQLYKIGDFVTWAWNYTGLQATPTAIDVLASCSFATRTFTLTQNMTFQTLGSYTWDTGAYQSSNVASPLLTEQYTLIIYDAESSVSATAEAGYLDTYDGFTFGMYAPQSYTPLSEGWMCATCSGALSDTERRALGFALTMSIITVVSFTWFVTGMHVAL